MNNPGGAVRRRPVSNPYLNFNNTKKKASASGKPTTKATTMARSGSGRPRFSSHAAAGVVSTSTSPVAERRVVVANAASISATKTHSAAKRPTTTTTTPPRPQTHNGRATSETGTAKRTANIDDAARRRRRAAEVPKGNRAVTPTPEKRKGKRAAAAVAAAAAGPRATGNDVRPAVRAPPPLPPLAPRPIDPVVIRGGDDVGPSPKSSASAPGTTGEKPAAPRRRAKTLKSQLKSQIADLHRRKRLFLKQKEEEKLRKERERLAKIKEAEERKKRRIREEELEREREKTRKLLERREAERRAREVKECVDWMAVEVARRMEFEGRRGVHYAVGEAVESIVCRIEEDDRVRRKDEARRKREERRRIKQEQEKAKNDRRTAVNAMPSMTNDLRTVAHLQLRQVEEMTMNNWIKWCTSLDPSHLQHFREGQMVIKCYMAAGNSARHPSEAIASYATAAKLLRGHNDLGHSRVRNDHFRDVRTLSVADGANTGSIRPNLPWMRPPSAMAPSKPPGAVANPVTAHARTMHVAKPSKPAAPLALHASPITDPHSPYSKSHHAIETEVVIAKKAPGDSFGVALRWECKSALVPLPVAEDAKVAVTATCSAATGGTATTTNKPPRKPRRKRVNYGVLMVANADGATFEEPQSQARTGRVETLRPGDLILTINGQNVGAWRTFTRACRAISDVEAMLCADNVIRCLFKVARRNVAVPKVSLPRQLAKPPSATSVPKTCSPASTLALPAPALPAPAIVQMIPFDPLDEKTEFTTLEWTALIRGLSTFPHQLFSGMALVSVSQKQVLDAIRQNAQYGKCLQQRNVEALGMKLEYESNRITTEMKLRADTHWKMRSDETMLPSKDPVASVPTTMTDARRGVLRGAARPAKGCKCGSLDHEFANDPGCPLYADVRRYCSENSIVVQSDGLGERRRRERTKLCEAKKKSIACAIERAHVDRFERRRAETAAIEEEAEFVMEMEKIQSSRMKKAVFAPKLLCALVLSAVASIADCGAAKEKERTSHRAVSNDAAKLVDGTSAVGRDGTKKVESRTDVCESDSSDDLEGDDSDSDDSDDEDMPLNSLLVQNNSPKRPAEAVSTKPSSSLPPFKRPKTLAATLPVPKNGKKTMSTPAAAPSPYFLAKILKHVSEEHGHLFQEPSHADFAWHQRHRSTLTSPLPKEVMFKGNPRAPGSLSFENIRFLLDEKRMSRLQNARQPATTQMSSERHQSDRGTMERLNDEWIVARLSTDEATGLRHEVDVLLHSGILSVETDGELVLKEGWERRIPHMVLNEMRDSWGAEADVHNLFRIHERVKGSLESRWIRMEDGWRLASPSSSSSSEENDGAIDGGELLLDDEEYRLREQIFTENRFHWVSEKSGMGEFGV